MVGTDIVGTVVFGIAVAGTPAAGTDGTSSPAAIFAADGSKQCTAQLSKIAPLLNELGVLSLARHYGST